MTTMAPEGPPQFITPELIEQITPIQEHERVPALLGIKRFIAEHRAEKAQGDYEEIVASDHVIRNAPYGAQRIRGFSDVAETNDVRPLTIVERSASQLRQFQASKITETKRKLKNLNSNYSEPDPSVTAGLPDIDTMSFPSSAAKRYEINRRKLLKADAPSVSSLGSVEHVDSVRNDRLLPRQRRFEKRSIRQNNRMLSKIQRLETKMIKGEEGDTPHGRMRARKIQEAISKQKTNSSKVDELDKLIVPTAKAKARRILERQNKFERIVDRWSDRRLESFEAKERELRDQISSETDSNKKSRLERKLNRTIAKRDEYSDIVLPIRESKQRDRARRKIDKAERTILGAQYQLGERWADAIESDSRTQLRVGEMLATQKDTDLSRTAEGSEHIKQQYRKKIR